MSPLDRPFAVALIAVCLVTLLVVYRREVAAWCWRSWRTVRDFDLIIDGLCETPRDMR